MKFSLTPLAFLMLFYTLGSMLFGLSALLGFPRELRGQTIPPEDKHGKSTGPTRNV